MGLAYLTFLVTGLHGMRSINSDVKDWKNVKGLSLFKERRGKVQSSHKLGSTVQPQSGRGFVIRKDFIEK